VTVTVDGTVTVIAATRMNAAVVVTLRATTEECSGGESRRSAGYHRSMYSLASWVSDRVASRCETLRDETRDETVRPWSRLASRVSRDIRDQTCSVRT